MRRTAEESARTRASLIDAALDVFAELGVGQTRLSDVAERAGMTRGAVYHHFRDKDDLYAAVVEASWSSTGAAVWQDLDGPGSVRERWARFGSRWLERLRDDRQFRALLAITIGAGRPMADSDQDVKGDALDDWHRQLQAALGEPAMTSRQNQSRATSALAWLCGTALLAHTNPSILFGKETTMEFSAFTVMDDERV